MGSCLSYWWVWVSCVRVSVVLLLFSQLIFPQSSPVNNNHFILKIQVVSRAVGLLESQRKVIKLMSKSCPLHLLLCGRYCSFHTPIRKVRFNLEEKILRTFGEFSCTLLSLNIPLAMVYNVSVTRTKKKITISNRKAILPFAIITVLSNKAFVIDTRVYINWNENFKTRVFKFSALDRKFQNTSCSNAPKMVIFFCSIFCQSCNQMKVKPLFS